MSEFRRCDICGCHMDPFHDGDATRCRWCRKRDGGWQPLLHHELQEILEHGRPSPLEQLRAYQARKEDSVTAAALCFGGCALMTIIGFIVLIVRGCP